MIKKQKNYFLIKEYITLSQYPGRSLLQELFEKHPFYVKEETSEGSFFKHILDELNKMANGEISWEDFTSYIKKILSIK